MEPHALLRFYHEIASLHLELVEAPSKDEIADQGRIIDPKDAHVLAAALKGETNFLLTLGRRHFMVPAVLEAGLRLSIMTPGDFLRHWLRQTWYDAEKLCWFSPAAIEEGSLGGVA